MNVSIIVRLARKAAMPAIIAITFLLAINSFGTCGMGGSEVGEGSAGATLK
jgi:hypothetical protein